MTDVEKQKMLHNTFRRASLEHTTMDKAPRIAANRMGEILLQMGQAYDEKKLEMWIKKIDPKNTGYLDHDQYDKICKEFVTSPAALANMGGNEFLFKQLILPEDFANP